MPTHSSVSSNFETVASSRTGQNWLNAKTFTFDLVAMPKFLVGVATFCLFVLLDQYDPFRICLCILYTKHRFLFKSMF